MLLFSAGELLKARTFRMHYTSKHRLWIATKGTCQGKSPETPYQEGG